MSDPNSQPLPVVDPYEAAADETIAICGGDTRAAVKALIIANAFLEQELEQAKAAVSRGYSRGRYARTANQEAHS